MPEHIQEKFRTLVADLNIKVCRNSLILAVKEEFNRIMQKSLVIYLMYSVLLKLKKT